MTSQQRALSHAERLDWLRLIRSENVGPITFRRLIDRFGSAAAALTALPELARRGGRAKPVALYPRAAAERELEALERLGAQLLAQVEAGYPPALRAVEDAPPLLTARGNLHLSSRPAVAVVGARNASLAGRRLARVFAEGLAAAGYLVASGMARGIDTAAHEGALAGGTAAVLAGGVDVVYPPENQHLYQAIVAQGLVVSEMPPGTQPQAAHFPRRNRIISGMSVGVVVVEATPKSGSLITARYALDQGREVFGVPGSPLDPRAHGPNGLIRQGARLAQNAAEVIDDLSDMLCRPLSEPGDDGFAPPPPQIPEGRELERARAALVEALGPTPVAVDSLIRECQLSASVVSMILLELDLAGRLERHSGNKVSLLR